jgi:hypothetical protein
MLEDVGHCRVRELSLESRGTKKVVYREARAYKIKQALKETERNEVEIPCLYRETSSGRSIKNMR